MNKTVYKFISVIAILGLTFGNYSRGHAQALLDVFSGSLQEIRPIQQGFSSTYTSAGSPLPFGQTNSWNLIFADEFAGTSLDLTKWRPNWLGPNDTSITPPVNSSEVSCYDPQQVKVVNGELNLTSVQRTCSNWKYASGLVQSNGKFNFTYGYAEAKIWTPAGTGMWPAFWTDGRSWPTDGEIDVLEAYGTNISTYHYHYAGCGGDCGPGGQVSISGATSGWHVYAVDWEPGVITWYYDGQQVWKYSTNVVSSSHYLILNLGLESNPTTPTGTMRVDYVRVWKNAPGSTSASPTATVTASSPTPIATVKVSATPVIASPTATAKASATLLSATPTTASKASATPVPASLTASLAPVMPTATATAAKPFATPLPPSATPTIVASPTHPRPTPTTGQANSTGTEKVYDDKSDKFQYSAGWQDVAQKQAYGGSYKQITQNNSAYVTFTFMGQSFSILYTSDPAFRRTKIYLDGTLIGKLAERSKVTKFQERWNYSEKLAPGTHTLKLVLESGDNGEGKAQGSIDAVIVR